MKKNKEASGKKLLVPAADWRKVHPMTVECKSDFYYAQLSSTLATLLKNRLGDVLGFYNEDFRQMGITLAAYLEDKVSGLNMWNSFISLYRKQYGDSFPFYDTEGEEMYDDEPNFSDIRFLLLHCINQIDDATFINPLTEPVRMLAEEVFELFGDAYEEAPESHELRDHIYDLERYDDVIKVRELCNWVVGGSYLFSSFNLEEHFEEINDHFSAISGDMDDMMKAYFFSNYLVMNTSVGPLDLYPWEYIAEMLEMSGDEKLMEKASMLREIKSYAVMPYKVVRMNEEGVVVRNYAGEEITVSYDMLTKDAAKDIDRNDVIITTLFYCNGEWNINGASSIIKSDAPYDDVVKEIKDRKGQQESARKYYLKKNGGSPIGFDYSYEDFQKRFGFDSVPDNSTDEMKKKAKEAKDILYFVNDDGTLSMLYDRCDVVKLPGNSLYDKGKATKESAQLILSDETTDEMRRYLIDNNLIPDARLKGPQPDEVAKEWFQKYARYINCCSHSDRLHFNLP